MSVASEAAPLVGTDGEPRDISDETLRRLLWLVGIVLSIGTLAALVVGAVVWAQGDKPLEPLGQVDVGFMQDMIDHHEQAVLIANTYLANNPNGGAYSYAIEVILDQRKELALMDKRLGEAGYARGAADRAAMTWMGMDVAVADMPGMQTPARIVELDAARGADADRLFFQIMSDHHLGGVHMSEYAAKYANRQAIRTSAEAMAYNQKIEVVEYEYAMERLGLV
jgi:uncharacterized protein (DUF305 family)